jgi:hypothetical protein
MESNTQTQDESPTRELVPPHVLRAAWELVALTRDYAFRERFGIRSGGAAELTNAICFGTFYDWAQASEKDVLAAQPGADETTRFIPAPGRKSMEPLIDQQMRGFLRPLWGYAVRTYIGQWPTEPEEEHLLSLLLIVDGWFEGYDITAEELVRGLSGIDLPVQAWKRAMSRRRIA